MADQHDRPRVRRINEKADSFWSALRLEFLVQNYVFRKVAGLDYKPRLARVSCNFRIPAKAKSGQFLVRTQNTFFRAILPFFISPDCSNIYVLPGLRPGKADSFLSVVQCKKIRKFEKVQPEISREIGFDNPAPSYLFRTSSEEKSGQFLVRTHVRKNAQIPGIFVGVSGALKLHARPF